MSRAEKKLAELKAKEELRKLKVEKRERQQQEWEAMPESAKTAVKVIGVGIVILLIIGMFSAAGKSNQSDSIVSESNQVAQEAKKEEPKVKTAKESMLESINNLIKSKDAFDTGSYIKGDIPVGEYAFMPFEGSGKYYSEEDGAGNILDNENFDSFGYVYVQGAGNLQTRGVLIKLDAFEKLSVKSAKEIYEKLNNITDYKDGAIYKVGVDIAPGTYVVESYGQGYVEVKSGPVGDSDIVDNENFNGKHSVSVGEGQYLKISRAKLL